MSAEKTTSLSRTSDRSTAADRIASETCTFSDFIIKNYRSRYHAYISFCFRKKLLPFTGNKSFYYEKCLHTGTEILTVHVNRTGRFSARINTIVRASFSYMKNAYKFRYRVEGTLKTSEKCSFFENIYMYSKKDIPEGQPLSDYLIPYLSRKELDSEAETILETFYPEAVQSPVPVNAYKLAENMGFRVVNARLSEDYSKFGSIFFDRTEITVYNAGTPATVNVPAGTILIDTLAHKVCCINTDDVIVHECVHAYEHCLFFFLQSVYRSAAECRPLPLEEITNRIAEDSPLQWIENQASHITPRIRMPLSQAAVKAAELSEKYKSLPKSVALEKVTADLAGFYNVSEFTARNRLTEIIKKQCYCNLPEE